MTIPSGRAHTAAVVAALDAAGISTGNGIGANLSGKYAVVYSDLGALDGPLGDRFADLEQTIFVHSVGVGPDQAQWVADKSRTTLLAGVDVPGRARLNLVHTSSQPVQRDDDVKPPVFYAVDIYTLSTTPG